MPKAKKRQVNGLSWVADSLREDYSYFEKPMFGALACYFNGLMALVLCDGDEPWNGVLFPTSREHHESLLRQFDGMVPHSVLGKWLYFSQNNEHFESTIEELVGLIAKGDPRLGILPQPRKSRKQKVRRKK